MRNTWSFGLGTLGRDMVAAMVSMYMLFYLTDVIGLSNTELAVATTIIVVLRIFDAVNDPLMGFVVDNTRTRWGKFKPWIAVGALAWGAASILLFVDTGLRGPAFLALFAVLYLLWDIGYTLNDISYYGMLPSLTRDQREREKLGVVARICANVGLFALVVAILPVTAALGDALGSYQRGWLALAVITVLLMLVFQSLTLVFTRQKVDAPAIGTPLRDLVGVIARNDQLLWAAVSMLIFMAGYMTITSLGIYYFKYIYGDENIYPIFAAVLAVAQLTGLAILPLLAQRMRRRSIHTLATALCLAGLVVFVFASGSLPLVVVSGLLLFVGQGFIQLLMLMYIADSVEYGEWKFGRRNESITLSLQPFVYKASSAIGTAMVGVALLLSGVNEAVSDADLTDSGRAAFLSVMLGVPITLIAISWWLLRARYELDEERYRQITADLAEREAEGWMVAN